MTDAMTYPLQSKLSLLWFGTSPKQLWAARRNLWSATQGNTVTHRFVPAVAPLPALAADASTAVTIEAALRRVA